MIYLFKRKRWQAIFVVLLAVGAGASYYLLNDRPSGQVLPQVALDSPKLPNEKPVHLTPENQKKLEALPSDALREEMLHLIKQKIALEKINMESKEDLLANDSSLEQLDDEANELLERLYEKDGASLEEFHDKYAETIKIIDR